VEVGIAVSAIVLGVMVLAPVRPPVGAGRRPAALVHELTIGPPQPSF
jgi:hydrogenase/urease accessory protein HupE